MHGNKILSSPLHYFTIGSGSIYSEEFTKHEDAIYNRDAGAIAGVGLYYQNDSEGSSLIVYSSCFYESYRLHKKENLDLMHADDPQTKSIRGFGVDIGTELKFGNNQYVLKAEYTIASKVEKGSFNVSLTVPLPFGN